MAGCQSDPAAEINRAAINQAIAETPRPKPVAPDYCTAPMPIVVPKLGEPVYITQMRWEIVREQENKRNAWCIAHGYQVPASAGEGKGTAGK